MSDFLYLQLEREFSEAIEQGRWGAGERLPSVRTLCRERQLSKATVLHAYNRMEARGLIEARAKAGYFVRGQLDSRPPPAAGNPDSVPALVSVSDVMRDIMTQSAAFDILPSADQRAETPPGVIELNRSIARALRHQRGLQHQYYDAPTGTPALREQLARRYQRLGCALAADDLNITAGCQQALFLALMACCKPGDVVAVESPGFYGVLQLAESLGLQVLEIPAAADSGLNMDSLAEALKSWPVRACVVTPAFATPSGSLMPQAARSRLLALAEQHDFVVIEDDIYGDLAFDQRPPPLKALDHSGRVILCGSVSKSLSRDLRLGWIAAGPWQTQVNRLKLVNMLACSRFIQRGLSDFIGDGGYDRHLRRQRSLLADQRDQLAELLDRDWPFPVRFSLPAGGLTLWLELPEAVDTLNCYRRARDHGLIITPGALFTGQKRYQHCLRLSFAHPWNEPRRQAVTLLGELLAEG
ncbi:aminotransferase-like domain-containing protein [Marinobacterium arenosum]|uniref:aminotransferase-like domain-containing protein n=1 Tax=Marinobacterium arenosum TaxID=2862496 RepID=UPI001C94D881|nr:PLP-dependent aminotransferase family protein [Marinobacterium arenosum]MBY4676269.1 PLP-dependent aminotransferase family protein [Marinobacterium arenosum]